MSDTKLTCEKFAELDAEARSKVPMSVKLKLLEGDAPEEKKEDEKKK